MVVAVVAVAVACGAGRAACVPDALPDAGRSRRRAFLVERFRWAGRETATDGLRASPAGRMRSGENFFPACADLALAASGVRNVGIAVSGVYGGVSGVGPVMLRCPVGSGAGRGRVKVGLMHASSLGGDAASGIGAPPAVPELHGETCRLAFMAVRRK